MWRCESESEVIYVLGTNKVTLACVEHVGAEAGDEVLIDNIEISFDYKTLTWEVAASGGGVMPSNNMLLWVSCQ